jgi:hypothetical protein
MQIAYTADTQAQRARLLERLKEQGSVSTIEARHELDIAMPAARVHELRHDYGMNITTKREWITNPGGGKHRFAGYTLLDGKYQSMSKVQVNREGANNE